MEWILAGPVGGIRVSATDGPTVISATALVNVLRLKRWYRRTFQSLEGDWVLRNGWWYWIERPEEVEMG